MNSPRAYLAHLNSSIIRLGLEPVKNLLASLHNPQNNYASILIGGTNGKGSIAATMAAILQAAGYRVGLYTSPHLIDLRERIRVSGEMIGEKELAGYIDEVREKVGEEEVTYFEFLTAVAFLYFYRRQVEVAVLEVGLGGRLDATNVVNQAISVISNISLEHQEYLGKRLADIAREKGGIIGEGGVCVTAAKQKQVREILTGICRDRGAKLYQLGKDIRVRRRRDGTFSYQGPHNNYLRLSCQLKGRHQTENTALALATIDLLGARGLPVSEGALRQGLEMTKWEGRLEVLSTSPHVVVDGGHNPAGITVLCRALKKEFSYRRLILIFGVLRDKDFAVMLKKIAPLADMVILARPESDRAVSPNELAGMAGLYCKHVVVHDQPRRALEEARDAAGREDLICVAGSLYLIGEIKRQFGKVWGNRRGIKLC